MYMCPNFGFIHFPDNLTTGSSIMPHKKNPDVWEMVRGKCCRILSCENEINMMISNMPHGYHRDYQLLKDVLWPAVDSMHACLGITSYMLDYIEVNTSILDDPKYKYLFTVEEVNSRVLSGVPFRDAYRQVGLEVNEGSFSFCGKLNHTHEGSIGNLCNDKIALLMKDACKVFDN